MQVKISSALPDPDKSQDNGLEQALEKILRNPTGNVLAVVLLHAREIVEQPDTKAKTAKLGIVGIEVMDGVDELLAMDLMQLYRNNRTGQAEIRHNELEARQRRAELMATDKAKDLPTESMFGEPGF